MSEEAQPPDRRTLVRTPARMASRSYFADEHGLNESKRFIRVIRVIRVSHERGSPAIPHRGVSAQIFGNVTPCCPWYLPALSLYDVSGGSSPSKNTTCAMPSLA